MFVTEHVYDLLIIGGGPAGMAAAATAATSGLTTVLIDERPTLGGQVYKQPGPGMHLTDAKQRGAQYTAGRALIDEVERSRTDILLRSSVVDLEPEADAWVAMTQTGGDPVVPIRAHRVIVAAGAYDRPVVFPGWTLPGVMTAGGLQTLAKTQSFIPGRRIVFAGSGPVALAFPAQLVGYGANIVATLEAGSAPTPADLIRIAAAAPGNLTLLRDAARYQATLVRHRIPLKYRRIVVRAEGVSHLERVVFARVDADWRVVPDTEESVAADVLCIGYGFLPSTELLHLIGCGFDDDENLGGAVVRTDTWCRTDVSGVYAVGDGTGVEGSAVAADEGRIAALAVARDMHLISAESAITAARPLQRQLARRRALMAATRRMYRVGDGIFQLAKPETTVCRCEGVVASAISDAAQTAPDISAVKALTRAGMGPCQGRMCGRHIAAMIATQRGVPIGDITPATPRMPVRPTPIAAIADRQVSEPGLFLATETTPVEPPRTDPAPATGANRAVPDATDCNISVIDTGEPTHKTSPDATDCNVLVIGGGVAGTAVAYYLAREGVDVELLERGELNREASGTNAGSFHFQLAIHQLSGKGTGADKNRLLDEARASLVAYRLWTKLSIELDGDLGLHQTGGWMVAETPEQLAILHEKHTLEEESGISTEVLTGGALRNRAPYFSERVLGASYCDLEGHANPLVTAILYAQRAVEHGARVRTHTEVFGIGVDGTSASPRFTVHTNQGTIRARRVINCAGGWAGDIAEMVGLRFPIRREGLHVNVTEARPPLLPSMVQHIGRRLTLKQTTHGGFIIGGGWPTAASGYPRRFPTTWRSAAGNLRVALDIVPELENVRVVRTWSGIIAFTDDLSPIVGESARVPGFFACVSTTGFTFSPLFARQLAEHILDGGLSPFPERFSIDRALTAPQKVRSNRG